MKESLNITCFLYVKSTVLVPEVNERRHAV